jgi:murein DD-endopeptidase MepM/ murein hydrolase activator NlpD
MRWALLLVCGVCCAETARQGGVVKVHGPAAAVAARMGEKTVRLFPAAGGRAFGLMPVAIDAKPGEYKLELLDQAGAAVETVDVRVVDAHYRKQNVAMAESTAELKPSPGETETAAAFRNTVSDARYWEEPLARPVAGCMTSPFGVQRYVNGKRTGSAHSGLDLRSAAGTPIRAAAAGVVKIVKDWNLHGRTVGIDHGQGLETMYLHMSKPAVSEGQKVNQGDVIGYVGSTGRSTAPHLHWNIYANGWPVNPLEWVKVAPCAPKGSAKKR